MSSLVRCVRKVFIGDVHGCFDELKLLLTKINHDPKRDELYFVGDLTAKGPNSEGVVSFVRNTENAFSVLGNHDYALLQASKENKLFLNDQIKYPTFAFDKYSGSKFMSRLSTHLLCAKTMSADNMKYLATLPLYLSPHPNIYVVHAGLVPGLPAKLQSEWDLMNMRNIIERPTPKHAHLMIGNKAATPRKALEATAYHDMGSPWISFYNGPQHIFFGHDAKRGLQGSGYTTGLDTGCCYGGSLTAAIVKFDLNNELIGDPNESKFLAEDWETDSRKIVAHSGVTYRLVRQRAMRTYQEPFRPTNDIASSKL